MPLKIPPELKKITQYIRRAEELDRDKTTPQTRLVAYYCRQHAVQIGIPLATTASARECLSEILNDLEKEKKAMNNFTKQEAYTVCREFAMKVFDKADTIDRNGKSDKNTAKSFYAAASFLDVLSYFHGGDSSNNGEEKSEEVVEEEKKSFYAKWKATDILKAIREGREIQPGGFGETVDGDDAAADKEETEESQTMPPPPPYSAMTTPSAPPAVPVPPPSAPAPSSGGGFMSSFFAGLGGNNDGDAKYPKDVLDDAKELTKFALQALNEKDGDLAAQRLQQALEVLAESQQQS